MQPPLPAQVDRYILNFLSSQPTRSEIAEFRPTPEMQSRLLTLLSRHEVDHIIAEKHEGRTTVTLLQLNSEERIIERRRIHEANSGSS